MAGVPILPMPGGTVSAQLLDPVHYESFQTAVSQLLSTEIARETIAQLMDGLPLFSVLRGTAGVNNLSCAPIKQHTALCEGAAEHADAFISSFDANLLRFNPSLMQAFQHSEPGTDAFLFRLLELLSRSIHCIAADMAGYWAEDRIFGGVVLFDRGASGTEANSVWLHSGRKRWTKRIWKPLAWQLRSMAKFFSGSSAAAIAAESEKREKEIPSRLLADMSEHWKSTFPFFCDVDNLERHDDYDAVAYHNIYRDPWERRLTPTKPQSCTQNTFDYPEFQDVMEAIMFYPVPDTVPTIADVNYPRDLNMERRSAAAEASDAARYSENIIGHFQDGKFVYEDPTFDIDQRIQEVV